MDSGGGQAGARAVCRARNACNYLVGTVHSDFQPGCVLLFRVGGWKTCQRYRQAGSQGFRYQGDANSLAGTIDRRVQTVCAATTSITATIHEHDNFHGATTLGCSGTSDFATAATVRPAGATTYAFTLSRT